jgi:hypothetical protein
MLYSSEHSKPWPCLDAAEIISLSFIYLTKLCFARDSIGSSCVIGDSRWAGSYGVTADFVAQSHCSVEFIPAKAINVRLFYSFQFWYTDQGFFSEKKSTNKIQEKYKQDTAEYSNYC